MRTFFALSLPEHIQQQVAETISTLQKMLPPNKVHWKIPHHLHITLQFLKEIKPEDISSLVAHVKTELNGFKSFDVELKQIELFPSVMQPRFISIYIEPQKILAELAEKISRGILATHYPVETRAFRGHLTLGKVVTPEFNLEKINFPLIEKFTVNHVILYQSKPMQTGSHYTPIDEISL